MKLTPEEKKMYKRIMSNLLPPPNPLSSNAKKREKKARKGTHKTK